MSKSYELNSQTFHDGRVVLYQRPHLKKPLWQARIKIPGSAGYVIKTTGTTDLFEARRWAENFYDDMRLKAREGLSIKGKSFAKLLVEFEKAYQSEATSPRRYDDVLRFLKTYALPYFGKTKVEDINGVAVTKFFDWRKENGRRTKRPTNTTILAEMNNLKVFLDWCFRRGHASRQVQFDRPSHQGNRRPHFDDRDWAKLTRFLREWVKQARTEAGGGKYRERVMLTNYILILANTGIRVGEARNLRWKDIDTDTGAAPESTENIILQVSGKTGAREVVARTNQVKAYFQRIWKLRCDEKSGEKPSLNEPVFAHRDGRPIGSFKKGFQKSDPHCGR